MRIGVAFAAYLSVLVLSPRAVSQAAPFKGEEAALARLDTEQKAMVSRADIKALTALSARGLKINAPTGRVLSREQFLQMMRDGRIGAEDFERTIESVQVSGDVGVVMGREVFTPTAESELGRTYGAVPLKRRYTNVYQRNHGRWLWLARHANVVAN